MIAESIAVLSLGIWVYLLSARGGFWRVSNEVLLPFAHSSEIARVAVVIPARDEAQVVAESIHSLLAQDYRGAMHIFMIDDHSSDQTTSVALQAAAQAGKADTVTVIPSAPLVSGWTGKLWAVAQGVQHAKSFNPDFLWLTDADIVHTPTMLSSLVAKATSGKFDLVSVMVKLRCQTWAERAFVPAFVFFFFKLYPPSWVANRRHRTAAAAGGCILIRAETLSLIGGIESIRDQLIDDCALARRVKSVGQIWMGLSPSSRSIRGYATWTEVGRMVARNAFTQLHHSIALLFATAIGMAITYLVPPLLALSGGWTSAVGLITWALMMISFYPMLKFYGRSPLWAPLLPAIAFFYLGATVYSAFQYWTGRGGEWKGRVQDPIATVE